MPDAPWSCALLFTRHANARIRERKIRREVVRPTIIKGRTIAQSGGKLVSHRHGRRIVWVKKPCHFVVVTVM